MNSDFIISYAEFVAHLIELTAISIIFYSLVLIVINMFMVYVKTEYNPKKLRSRIINGIQAGLDLLIISDIVGSISLKLTMDDVLTLGILVIVRTILSWSFTIDMEGRLPWKKDELNIEKE